MKKIIFAIGITAILTAAVLLQPAQKETTAQDKIVLENAEAMALNIEIIVGCWYGGYCKLQGTPYGYELVCLDTETGELY